MMDVRPHRLLPKAGLRRDLVATAADAAAFSVMVGCGETYIPAFALALGMGPVAAGMMASVPLLAGAFFQLVTPLAVARMGTNRGWVILCVAVQAISFLPLVYWALRGRANLPELLIAASVYWAAGMASAPAWSTWIGTLIPVNIRTAYFAHRSRLGQFGILFGFVVGGIVLQIGEAYDRTLVAFAVLFALAATCRLMSTVCLIACRELERPLGHKPEPGLPPKHILQQLKTAVSIMAASPSGALISYLWTFAFAAQCAGPYFTPYMLRELGFSYGAFMLVAGMGILAKALALPSLGRLGSRIGSVRLLWIGGLSTIPLALLWLPSSNVGYLVCVQVLAGVCWASYELAIMLLFFDAVGHRERTGVVTAYNLGLAIATVAGAVTGGVVLRAMGEDRTAYVTVFAISSLLRLASLPLLGRVRAIEAHASGFQRKKQFLEYPPAANASPPEM